MESTFALLGLAIALFASTNVDDIFLLIGFFADPRFRTRDIVFGQYVGIIALFGGSLLASLLSTVIPRNYFGMLGIVAIMIGAKGLLDLLRERDRAGETLELHSHAGVNGRRATVSLLTIANGGDNIGIYTPAFAIRSAHEIAIIALVFFCMTALWCLAAYSLVKQPNRGTPIRRYGRLIAPIVLIGLGILIRHEAGSFALLLRHGGR